MQIISSGDNFHDMLKFFLGNEKYHQKYTVIVVCLVSPLIKVKMTKILRSVNNILK